MSGYFIKNIKKAFRVAGFIIIFLCLTAITGVLIGLRLNQPPDRSERYAVFEVKAGENARAVGRRLEGEGFIRSRYFWYIVSRIDKDFLKAGVYTVKMPATQFEIHNILESGRQILIKITIPEGETLSKTARLFEEASVCTAEAFLKAAENKVILEKYRIPAQSMEGYLFPDTYLFQENYPAEKAVQVMADNFFKRIAATAPLDSLKPEELFEKVTLASIVEREYRLGEEASIMAGVFYNRLKINMALQSCATVEYVITEIQGKPHPEVLYTRDTEIENPYNTYVRKGLPPGPISSPGLTSLSAVFNPKPSDYLYFRLIDPNSGRHYFSKTLDDHIKAGTLYVKKRG